MIAVAVGEQHVLDSRRIEPHLLQAIQNLVARRIVEQRFEDDDAVAADDGPCMVDLGPEKVEVVGNLRWFGVPDLACRRDGRASAPRATRTRGPTGSPALAAGSSSARASRRQRD